ncbi:3-dehydroquinate synthase [bacterium]|nr:3-dehydroquinate synthase [bacterium]
MSELNVQIKSKEKSYPIFINNENLENLRTSILTFIKNNNYIIIFSRKVYKIYGKILNFPKDKIFILKDGENEKNKKNLDKILNFALSKKLTRQDYIIAIGGGVVGDISGFAASIYMRGINFIQVPTTLLACTDSSVGGKTAINTDFGKNLIGTFYQPKAVFINVNFLKTLDERQFKSGLGEVVKYGFIEKSCHSNQEFNLINFLVENHDKILSKNILTLMGLIEICINLKISVVGQDEKESGLRKILNLGHTYAHAIETLTKYKKYTHGECVVNGILFALKIAAKLEKIDKEYKFLCEDLINKFEFTHIPNFDINKIIKIMQSDKKATANEIIFILPCSYARVEEEKFTPDTLKEII